MPESVAPSSPASVVGLPGLVSLSAVKRWLNISLTDTNADDVLTSLISVASRQMLQSLDRGPILGFRTVTETRNGTGTNALMLRYWPVLNVSSLYINGTQQLPRPSQPVDPWAAGFYWDQWTGSDIQGRQRIYNNGIWFDDYLRQGVSITYTAGYYTVDSYTIQQTNDSVIGVQTYVPNRPFMNDQGVYDVETQAYMTQVKGIPQNALEYSVNSGVYSFNSNAIGRQVLVAYSYLPEELAQVVTNFVALQFKYRDHIGVNSKSMLGKETISYDRGRWDALTEAIIQPYRDVAPLQA